MPVLVDSESTRVKVCLSCILHSRNNPDEIRRGELGQPSRRRDIGNSTFTPAGSAADGKCDDGYRQQLLDTLNVVYDVCACVLALLFGYIEIQQDDRGMYSSALMGTSDSWENVRVADPNKADDAAT
ncbi:hypothetical protein PInf_029374 [Phytophthora infestans]|nr:hypothetical protein PInf_029374 [Phytophthora infestans]